MTSGSEDQLLGLYCYGVTVILTSHYWYCQSQTDYQQSPVISATSHLGNSQVGDKPRQTNSATRVGQLGDNLFRLSVCFVLIEQNKLKQESRAIAGKPCNAAVNFEYGVLPKQVVGHANFLTQAPARITAALALCLILTHRHSTEWATKNRPLYYSV